MKTRRDFLKQSGLAAAGIATARVIAPANAPWLQGAPERIVEMPADDRVRDLLMTALGRRRSR
jgi:hypothetical protein